MTLNILSQEFIEKYMLQRLRPSTIRGYRVNLERHILPILGGLEVGDITVDTLDDLTTALTQNLSNRSAVYAHATLRKTFPCQQNGAVNILKSCVQVCKMLIEFLRQYATRIMKRRVQTLGCTPALHGECAQPSATAPRAMRIDTATPHQFVKCQAV